MGFAEYPVLHDEVGNGAVAEQGECVMYRIDRMPAGILQFQVDLVVQGYAHTRVESNDIGQITQGFALIRERLQSVVMMYFECWNYIVM